MKNKKNIITFLIITGIVFISIYILNHYTVYTSDDISFLYDYKTTEYSEGLERITSISQIFTSMKNLYLNVNGRVICHGVLQFLLMFPKIIFNIVNSLMFIGLGLIIYKIATNTKKIIKELKPLTLILIYSLMYLILPSFGMTTLWCSGSLNYMWTTFCILLYFYYMLKLIDKKNINIKNCIIIFILSIISCNGAENISIATLFFTIIVTIISIIKNKKFKLWLLIPLMGNIIGLLLLFTAAPLGTRELSDNAFEIGKLLKMFGILFAKLNVMVFVIIIVLLLMYYMNSKNKKINRNILIYFFVAILSFVPLIVSPYIAERTFFLGICLLIICIVYLYENLVNIDLVKKIFVYTLLTLTIFVYFFLAFKDVKKSYDVYMKIETIIEKNKEINEKYVILPDYYYKYSRYTAFENVYAFATEYSGGWINEWMAYYYGVDYIKMQNNKK